MTFKIIQDYDEGLFHESILTFGCSFTSGPFLKAQDAIRSWPLYFSRMVSDNVINFAQGGSCLLYSIQQLEYIASLDIKPKFVFFQCTTYPRVSINPFIKPTFLVKKAHNYYQAGTSNLLTSNPSTIPNSAFTNYYKHFVIDNKLNETSIRAQVQYIHYLMQNFNGIVYAQFPFDEYQGNVDFFISDELFEGWDDYHQHVIDNGSHLNRNALLKQAEFLKTKFDKRVKV